MWNLMDSNKIVGMNMKVESYKSHLKNLREVKSQLAIRNPWTPTFSLSKRKNKYYKFLTTKIEKQNEALLQRMIQIEAEPMTKTVITNISNVPSNKFVYVKTKERERKLSKNTLYKENQKIMEKIADAESEYGEHVWKENWKKNMQYKKNILKKEHIADFLNLINEEKKNVNRNRRRPTTANPCG